MKRKIGKMLKNILPKTIDSIRNFTSDPINSLAYLTSVFTGIVAFISGIITYIMFIEQGGYTKQINEIKRTGALGNFENKFTTGTTNLILSGIAGKVIVFLILLEAVFLLIQYFRQNGRAKKIVLSIAGIIVIIQVLLNRIMFCVETSQIMVKGIEYKVFMAVVTSGVDPKIILIVYASITMISIITLLIMLLLVKDCRTTLGYMMVSLVAVYIVIPFLFLLLQNVIPLVMTTLAIIFITALMKGVVEGLCSQGTEKPSQPVSAAKPQKVKNIEKKENELKAREKKIDSNAIFWRDKGGYGIVVPENDCIYFKNGLTEKGFVCTVQEFEKGTVRIMNKGRRVMNISGCKAPVK